MQDTFARRAFNYWLRTGLMLPDEDGEPDGLERKYNHRHDPDDGRFTFAGQGRFFEGGVSHHTPPGSRSRTTPKPSDPERRPATRQTPSEVPHFPGGVSHHAPQAGRSTTTRSMTEAPLGSLAEMQEANRGPETISSGRDDPGGVSYGSYQLSTKTETLAAFLASPEFQPWARAFAKLKPGTADFDRQWIAAARMTPEAFRHAQRAFIMRTHYAPAAASVKRSTDYDLDTASRAVREASFSVSIQHSRQGAVTILSDAIQRTDKELRRTDRGYQRALILAIYDRRIEYVRGVRDRARAEGRAGDARTLNNAIENRYPKERDEALGMLPAR